MKAEDFNAKVNIFLKSWKVVGSKSENEILEIVSTIKKLYVEENNFVRGFARWYGDMLLGMGVSSYGNINCSFYSTYIESIKGQMVTNSPNLWFYELHAIPPWHHDETKNGSLSLKPKWCVCDHADCLPYGK